MRWIIVALMCVSSAYAADPRCDTPARYQAMSEGVDCFTPSLSITSSIANNFCPIASISMNDKSVTVRTDCVAAAEKEWLAGRGDPTTGSLAHILGAVLRGEQIMQGNEIVP